MGVKRLVNGHDREPKTWHEYIDEEEGGEEAQRHEAQHGSRAPVRAPLRYGAVRGRYLPQQNGTRVRADELLVAITNTKLCNQTTRLIYALRPHRYYNRTDIQSFSKLGSVLNTSQRSQDFKGCSQKSQSKFWPRNNYRFVLRQPQSVNLLIYNKCLIISQRACIYSKCPFVTDHLLQPR
jgi:hypothetical protein